LETPLSYCQDIGEVGRLQQPVLGKQHSDEAEFNSNGSGLQAEMHNI